jgi:hypothetical protein
MRRVASGQLSFDVAPKGKKPPVTASIKLSGTFSAAAITDDNGNVPQIGHGEQVLVQLVEVESGEVIASQIAIVAVAFADKQLDGEPVTVREQKVKLV